jgi:spore germination protein GerM
MVKRKKKKSKGLGVLFVILLVSTVAAGAIAYYMMHSSGSIIRPPKQKPVVTIVPNKVADIPEHQKVTLYLAKDADNGVYLVPATRTISVKDGILDEAIKALLTTNKEGGLSSDLIPQGTKLLSPVNIKNGVAMVNLSKEFVDNFSGGSDQEALTLNSIVETVVHNSGGEAEKVQILVEGKTVETLGGHFGLDEPIAPDSALLKPGN